MKVNWKTSWVLALPAVVLAAATATIALSRIVVVSESDLGPGWQCSRTMLFATTCSHSSVGRKSGLSASWPLNNSLLATRFRPTGERYFYGSQKIRIGMAG